MPEAVETALVAIRVHISGLVQGVGFRPFVWREATSRGLCGWVSNSAAGVVLEVEGGRHAVRALLEALGNPPPLARVDDIRVESRSWTGFVGFEVHVSDTTGSRVALVSPDTGTCTDCLREVRDPADRRFGYAFVNCTNCGPRYTIMHAVPYDRARTTMAPFPMCPACKAEYDDPADRRFHAEPVCCPACGPVLRLLDANGAEVLGDPIVAAAGLLREGWVLAIKGLGGYHLSADARQDKAITMLRGRKQREERPFALMVRDVAAAAELCVVSEVESELLQSAARPIVLLSRRAGVDDIAESVAPHTTTLGVMLAYTPLHALLLDVFDGPLVVTSGNASDEPIAFLDDDALESLAGIADAFLLHDRVIRTRVDDSVVKFVSGRLLPIRRSRGYAPAPIRLPIECAVPVLACGAGLKSTFCLARDSYAFVSHHIGDLDDWATLSSFVDGVAHLSSLLDVSPQLVAHDLHPDYPSSRFAQEQMGVELLGVQHHHAHIASCLADNGLAGPVIGVAFDGTGHGTDGTAWGGEFLIADLTGFHRAAHLAPVPMPGGDAATRQPWRMAAAHLDAAYAGAIPTGLAVASRQGTRWEQVLSVARSGIGSPQTTSAGRLFDAISALLGVRDSVSYEGQAAVELEQIADASEAGTYTVAAVDGVVDTSGLVRAIADDLVRGVSVPVLAARFHNALADVVTDVCGLLREQHGLATVALSGGVFQSSLLVARCMDRLESRSFTVLTHRQVPPNDGGISLGQAAVAAAYLRAHA